MFSHSSWRPENSVYFLFPDTVALLQGVPFSSSHKRRNLVLWKPLALNGCIFSTLHKCLQSWYQTVSVSSVVLHSILPPLRQTLSPCQPPAFEGGGGKQSRKPDLEVPNRSCFLPASLAEGKELFVHLTRGRSWEPLRLLLRSEDSGSKPVLLCPCYLAEPHLFIQVAFPGFISF